MECAPFNVEWSPWIVVPIFTNEAKGREIVNEIRERGSNVIEFEALIKTETANTQLEEEIAQAKERWIHEHADEEFVFVASLHIRN